MLGRYSFFQQPAKSSKISVGTFNRKSLLCISAKNGYSYLGDAINADIFLRIDHVWNYNKHIRIRKDWTWRSEKLVLNNNRQYKL